MKAPYRFGNCEYHGVTQISKDGAKTCLIHGTKAWNIASKTGNRYFMGDLPTIKILTKDMEGTLTRVVD